MSTQLFRVSLDSQVDPVDWAGSWDYKPSLPPRISLAGTQGGSSSMVSGSGAMKGTLETYYGCGQAYSPAFSQAYSGSLNLTLNFDITMTTGAGTNTRRARTRVYILRADGTTTSLGTQRTLPNLTSSRLSVTQTYSIASVNIAAGERLLIEYGVSITTTSNNTSLHNFTVHADNTLTVDATESLPLEGAASPNTSVDATPATASGVLVAPAVDPNAPINVTIPAGAMVATATLPRPPYKDSGAYIQPLVVGKNATADRANSTASGTATSLNINGGITPAWHAFIGFGELQFAGDEATLRIRQTGWSSSLVGAVLQAVSIDSAWEETSGDPPALGQVTAGSLNYPSTSFTGYLTIDVTAIVAAWRAGKANHGIALRRTDSSNLAWTIATRESNISGADQFGNSPRLTYVHASQANLQEPAPMAATGEMTGAVIAMDVAATAGPMQAAAILPTPDVEAIFYINHVEVNPDPLQSTAEILDATVDTVIDPNFTYAAGVFTAEASLPNASALGETPVSVTVLDTMDGDAEMLPATFNNNTDRTINAGVMWATGRLPALFDPYPIFLSRLSIKNRFALDENPMATEARNSIGPNSSPIGTRAAQGNPAVAEIVGDVETGNDLDLFGRRYYRFTGNGSVQFPNVVGLWRQTHNTGVANRWGAGATVFVFRTSQANADMSNALKLRNGRLYYDGTDQKWMEPGQERTITDFHRYGSRRYDDGEWHVFTEVRRPAVRIVNPRPLGGMITVQRTARLWFVDGVLDTIRANTMPAFDFRRLGGDGFVGDIAELALMDNVADNTDEVERVDLDTGFFTEHAKALYNAWFDYRPVFAKPMEATGSVLRAIGKGNRRRAIGFFTMGNNTVSDQFMTSQYIPNITHWDRVWTAVDLPVRTLNTDRLNGPPAVWGYENGRSHTGAYGDIRVETKRVDRYLDWITGQENDYVKFENPNEWDEEGSFVDLEQYDAIFIITGPRGGSPAARREWRERFVLPLLRKAAELEKPIIIHDPRVAEDFGVASRHEMVPAGQEHMYDYFAATQIPDLPKITVQQSVMDSGQPNKMPDNHFVNRAVVASELEGFTDIVDEERMHGSHVWSHADKGFSGEFNYGYKTVKARAWNVGDEIRTTRIVKHPLATWSQISMFSQNFQMHVAFAMEHLGQPLLKGPRTTWYQQTEYELVITSENRHQAVRTGDGTRAYIVHAGTNVSGVQITAPIFVDYTRSKPSRTGDGQKITVNNKTPSGSFRDQWPNWDFLDIPRTHYGSETFENVDPRTGLLVSKVTAPGAITRGYSENRTYFNLGERWRRYMERWFQERSGENINFSVAARATAEMPKPTVTADYPGGFTAPPMRAVGILREPQDMPFTFVYASPMLGTGQLSGIRKGTQPGPMEATGSLLMPPLVLAEGIGIAVYLVREPITVYLRT
jgi:hypothetical protein